MTWLPQHTISLQQLALDNARAAGVFVHDAPACCERDPFPEEPEPPELLPKGHVFMTWRELDNLPEYQISIPTGPKLGFRWRCSLPSGFERPPVYGPAQWFVAEVIRVDDKYAHFEWRAVTVIPEVP